MQLLIDEFIGSIRGPILHNSVRLKCCLFIILAHLENIFILSLTMNVLGLCR